MSNPVPDQSAPTVAETPTSNQGLTSVDRALHLIQLVGEHQALRVAEAADRLGVARSTAHRLLTALRRRDFVIQDRPNGAYLAGPALNAIGLAAISRLDIRQIARPVLEQLRDTTDETITLAVLDGQNIRFVDSIESPRSVRVGNRTGVVRPAHSCAVGKAILAGLSAAELDRLYPDEVLPEATQSTISSKQALVTELDEVKRLGYALNWEESTDGVAAIAVAVRDAADLPVAALGVAAPASRIGNVDELRRFAPDLQSGRQQIQTQLSGARNSR